MNTERDVYYSNESANLSFGVLDPVGITVCDADIEVSITNPDKEKTVVSTKNGYILREETCQNGYSQKPDYTSSIKLGESGNYRLQVTAETKNGIQSGTQILQVIDSVPFIVSRTSFPDRIYPAYKYKVAINVDVNKDFEGRVNEILPASLGVEGVSGGGVSYQIGDAKEVAWNVSWKKGQSYELSYILEFPEDSPEFYLVSWDTCCNVAGRV